MFEVLDGNRIRITQGDTGVLRYVPQTSRVFTETDRAVFTARKRNGEQLVKLMLVPDASGAVRIPFTHEVTKEWPDGRHEWQIRYFFGDDEVSTPMETGVLDVLRAV